jgi:adenylate cyclase
MLRLSYLLLSSVNRATAIVVRRLGNATYYLLAALVSLILLVDFFYLHKINLMEYRMFDFLVSHRIQQTPPDPEILIVDIDEASLNALAKDYGRWPWPRQVIGEWLEGVQQQNPKAVVFDILFSDSDVLNPDSESYFNQSIAASNNSFFPMLRLGTQNDLLSQVRPSMLPWLSPLPGAVQQDLPLAVVLPKFQAAIDSARIGTHQVIPDKDSVIRRYPIFFEHAGWKIPSLSKRIVEVLGYDRSNPDQKNFLINWRGKAFTFRYVSFGDVYVDFLKKNRQRPSNEFTGKIVILGSTAPSLFDIKASPTDKVFPGVEILATSIDNLKNDDSLGEMNPLVRLTVALIFIWGMAAALAQQVSVRLFDQAFAGLQVFLIGIAFLSVNFLRYYVDMTMPVTFGLVYFTVARAYTNLSGQWLADHMQINKASTARKNYLMRVLAISVATSRGKDQRALIGQVNRLVGESACGACRINNMIEDRGIVQDMFLGTMLVYWLIETDSATADDAAKQDMDRIQQGIKDSFSHLRSHFATYQDVIDFTAGGNWKSSGKRTIIKAFEKLSMLEPEAQPQAGAHLPANPP